EITSNDMKWKLEDPLPPSKNNNPDKQLLKTFYGTLESTDTANANYALLELRNNTFNLILNSDFINLRPADSQNTLSLEEAEKLMKTKQKRFEKRVNRFEKINADENVSGAEKLQTTKISDNKLSNKEGQE